MSCTVYVGDYGTKLLLTLVECDGTTPANISTPTTLEIKFLKPTLADPSVNELLTKTAVLETDGTDGKLYYIFENGFVDVAGKYTYQSEVLLASGEWASTTGSFKAKDRLAV